MRDGVVEQMLPMVCWLAWIEDRTRWDSSSAPNRIGSNHCDSESNSKPKCDEGQYRNHGELQNPQKDPSDARRQAVTNHPSRETSISPQKGAPGSAEATPDAF